MRKTHSQVNCTVFTFKWFKVKQFVNLFHNYTKLNNIPQYSERWHSRLRTLFETYKYTHINYYNVYNNFM